MKYLIKNSFNQYNQNYALYNMSVFVDRTLKRIVTIFDLTKLLRVAKRYYKAYTLSRRQAFIVHPNQRVNTNLDWTEILRSN